MKQEQVKLYNGEVVLKFDPVKHIYTVGDKVVDGITTVLGVIAKPALVFWAANKGAEYIEENLKVGVKLDEIQKGKLVDGVKNAHRIRSKDAADVGTLAHKFVEDYIKAKDKSKVKLPINKELKSCAEQFLSWAKDKKVKFNLSERRVYSRKYNYAGTLDFTAIVDGKNVIGDIKTSSGIYPEMWLQLTGYRVALIEEYPKLKIDHTVVVRTGKDGALEIKELNDFEKNKEAFLGALVLYRRLKEMKYQNYINKNKQ